jgi:predicted Zn-ribbon and HTH transcriptional regulator
MADTLEQIAEHIEAMNRDCVPGCEDCRRQRTRAILSALAQERDARTLRDFADWFMAKEYKRSPDEVEAWIAARLSVQEPRCQHECSATEDRCRKCGFDFFSAVQEPRGQEGE